MIDLAQIAAGATASVDPELPASTTQKRVLDLAPFVALVGKAKRDGKRYDLPGRFSLAPYAGRKNACEAQTVVARLHAAARQVGCKVVVRRVEPTATDTGIAFKVATK
jgi:hypothetical protein